MVQQLDHSVTDLDTYAAVYAVISTYHCGDILSTAIAIDEIRRHFPECPREDEELVGLILHALSGQTIAISFDHRVESVKARAAFPVGIAAG